MKPVIGIISRMHQIGSNDNYTLQYDYVNAIVKGGGIPYIIPTYLNDQMMDDSLKLIDGLLIPGGIDMNPAFYHEEVNELCGSFNNTVDQFELNMIEKARKLRKPILGICRGHQSLNVAYGGTLYQDLILYPHYNELIIHEQNKENINKTLPVHRINILPGSILHELYDECLATNSFHHQAIKELGKGLKAIAFSEDGVIEGIESTIDPFVLGVQWHPEKMVDANEKQLKLFKHFIAVCKEMPLYNLSGL